MMILKLIRFTLICGILISCQSQKVESEELSKKAFELYFVNCKSEKTICADSALTLYKRAVVLDDENFSAYQNMIPILTEKKDLDGLIETADNLIRLRPNVPYFKVQKSLFLYIDGEQEASNTLLEQAIEKYKMQLGENQNEFDLNMEYINALILNDQFDQAKEHLNLMKENNYLDFQNQLLVNYQIEKDIKTKMLEYFKTNKSILELIE